MLDSLIVSDGVDPIEIRRANVDDLDALVEIWRLGAELATGRRLAAGEGDLYRGYYHDKVTVQRDPFRIWVAIDQKSGRMIGWQSLQPYSNNPLDFKCNAEASTYIRPNSRKGMVGHWLLRHALRYAESTELEIIWALTMSSNTAARRMVKALGFQSVGRVSAYHAENGGTMTVWTFVVSRPK